jgi:hypothetical protein
MDTPFISYQTQANLKREHEIIEFLKKKWCFDYEKLDDFSVIDFVCNRHGKPVAYIEVKTKNEPYVKYETYICTTADINYGLKLSQESGLPVFLVVKWPDFFGYLKINHNNYRSRKSGQSNRNDPRDYNTLVYLIPRKEFKEIK